MTEKIKLLPESVANQIAAGEVVNRPASVVKEMVENAVDAGSKNITVCFRDGGKSLIRIVDDGCGMDPADARMAFERHATSKITTVEDIYTLSTFGFRGEALASIASVAEVELKTRTEGHEIGTQVEINGGKFCSQTPVSCPVGSQFTVRNLFYNVPARRRFLEKSSTEARHITAEFQRVALCNPEIGFSLYDGDSLLAKLPPATLRQRVVGVIGKNISRNLLDVTADTSIVRLEGFTGRPESARQTNREQFLFINGRYFRSPYFHKAVISAYDKLIQPGTQPSYFLYLKIDPERIDVNVHPQKTEVKFTDGGDIWQIINAAVRESLAKSGAVPALDFNLDTSVQIPVAKDKVVYPHPRITANPEFNPFDKYGDEIQLPVSESLLPDFDPSPADGSAAEGRG
ncbi:MAG: DNA mismatch repair endonuclease MutL, partial [Rikenellaceae bacterium]|nr:DNA mismatch repair endonuclease MutL [Rikenellaceae bacterium]